MLSDLAASRRATASGRSSSTAAHRRQDGAAHAAARPRDPALPAFHRKLVANGAEVKLVYVEGGLLIFTTGAALQDGATGDFVKVRNSDSGVTVSGAVQPDGSVRVSGG